MKRIGLAVAVILAIGLALLPEAASAGGGTFVAVRSGNTSVFINSGPFVHRPFFVDNAFFRPRFVPTGFVHPHFVSPVFVSGPAFVVSPVPRPVWVPGFWGWNGFRWIWVPGRWGF